VLEGMTQGPKTLGKKFNDRIESSLLFECLCVSDLLVRNEVLTLHSFKGMVSNIVNL